MPDTERSEVYLRLGSHSEKQYVLKTFHLFSGVLVGANLLESTPGATVSFAIKVTGKDKLFAIDPMTYTFGMDLEYIKSETIDKAAKRAGATNPPPRKGLKRSFAKLAQEYGVLIERAVKRDRPVNPDDFDDASIRDLCESIYTYQAERMRTYFDADVQLQQFANECPSPSFTFAPYFYVPYRVGEWRKWYELNLKLVSAFADVDGEIEKHGVICVDQSVLDNEGDFLGICGKFLDADVPAFWLWLSAFTEERISDSRVKTLTKAVTMFAEADRRLYNMHGGYLSALLSKQGLTGFSHGVGYGEGKDVVPVVGVVVPTVNYHYPPLHIRTSILEVERALSELGISDADDFHEKVCDCTVCKGVLAGDLKNLRQFGEFILKTGNQRESQTPDSAKKCRFHFLLARRKEVDHVAELTTAELTQELRNIAAEYAALPGYLTLQAKGRHLSTWAKAL